MYRAKRAYGGNNIYQRYRRYLQKIYCTVTRILWHTGMHAKTDIFTRNSRVERTNADLGDTVPNHESAVPTRAKRFIGVTTRNYFRARSRRIAFNRSHLYDDYRHGRTGVIKERRTRWPPLPLLHRSRGTFLATKRSSGADILIPSRFLA